MGLLYSYFRGMVLCAGSSYLTIGLLLFFLKIHKSEFHRSYRLSEKLLGSGYVAMSASMFQWQVLFTNDWFDPNLAVACSDILLFYAAGLCLSYAFANLLDRHYITRRRVVSDLVRWVLAVVVGLVAVLYVDGAVATWMLSFSLAMFLWFIVSFFLYFRRLTMRMSQLFDNYFSNDALRFVKWISESIGLLIISGLIGVITIYSGIVVNWIYQIYMVSINLYIAVNFINHADNHGKLQRAVVAFEEQLAEKARTAERKERAAANPQWGDLERRIKVWTAAKRFVNNSFTIEELARTLNTNKLYLSQYINETYGVNFRTWVAGLRIEEAKRVMADRPDDKLEDIAYRVGFSSASYFSKTFSDKEGMSPLQWHKEKAKGVKNEE